MSIKLISYLHFNGNAREAGEFYASVFGGTPEVSTFAEFSSEEMPVSDIDKDKVMHSFLKSGSIELMLSDTPSYMEYNDGSRVSLALNTDNEALGREYWDKLVDGGNVSVPLGASPWGSIFGMATDKFGIEWMFDIGQIQG